MDLFSLLIINILPLIMLIGMGYVGGRYLEINLHSMAMMVIFFLSPIVNFGAIVRIEFTPSLLALPVIVAAALSVITILSYSLAKIKFEQSRASLIGMGSGIANTGFFGFPIVLALFGADAAGIYLLLNLGLIINEVTTCYYVGARGRNSITDSIKRLLKMPLFHSVWLALIVNSLNIQMPQIFDDYWQKFAGAWVILGMFLIGVGISKAKNLKISPSLLIPLFLSKFIIWPLFMMAIILFDLHITQFYDYQIYMMFMVFGTVPLAGNLVAYSAQLDLEAEKAAMCVVMSSVFAVFYMPVILTLVRNFLTT